MYIIVIGDFWVIKLPSSFDGVVVGALISLFAGCIAVDGKNSTPSDCILYPFIVIQATGVFGTCLFLTIIPPVKISSLIRMWRNHSFGYCLCAKGVIETL